jgi:hypothetical protein
MVERSRYAEELGFDWVSFSEHHYSPLGTRFGGRLATHCGHSAFPPRTALYAPEPSFKKVLTTDESARKPPFAPTFARINLLRIWVGETVQNSSNRNTGGGAGRRETLFRKIGRRDLSIVAAMPIGPRSDLVDAAGFLHRRGKARAEVRTAGDDPIKRCVVCSWQPTTSHNRSSEYRIVRSTSICRRSCFVARTVP